MLDGGRWASRSGEASRPPCEGNYLQRLGDTEKGRRFFERKSPRRRAPPSPPTQQPERLARRRRLQWGFFETRKFLASHFCKLLRSEIALC